ncbi:MAG: translational GTPase TypA [Phycisphaerae bacterium]
MSKQQIRNVAIIAHVDHGKTTLVDQLLRQCGQFREGQLKGECIMDSNPLERERGITILAKNCAIHYTAPDGEDYHINIVDTPGHADFSGEVERVLKMADGVLLLVDAAEGVMPQTRYVLSKALHNGLKPIVVINKLDRPDARPQVILNQTFDLLIELGAEHHAEDFPVIYASGRNGWACTDMAEATALARRNQLGEPVNPDIHALFAAIIEHVPVPNFDAAAPLQALITNIDWSDYVGRIGIGRVFAGVLEAGKPILSIDRHGNQKVQKIGQLMQFDGLGRRVVDRIEVGDICAVVGLEKVDIGDTLCDQEHPLPLPAVEVDEPTLHMTFRINDGPFAGREGKYVTNRHIRERLERELQANVALRVDFGEGSDVEFDVAGRGLLHLGILLENMRREGYELCVGKPNVIYHRDGSRLLEPIEMMVLDVPTDMLGSAMQLMGDRRAEMVKMDTVGNRTVMEFTIPARGLIGLRNRMLTATKGMAIMHHRFHRYEDARGEIAGRANGVMVATDTGQVTAYALDQLADRGVMFVEPGDQVYQGQIVGEHCKDNDIPVNAVKCKRLTNMRQSVKDATVTLKAPRKLTLEAALEYIEGDELVEITPQSVRLRKRILDETQRKRAGRKLATAEVAD